MDDEWRVTIQLRGGGPAGAVAGYFNGTDLDHDLSRAFHDTVIVSHTVSEVFLCAGSREQAEKAQRLAERMLSERNREADVELRRWHPVSEEWEDPDIPLPDVVESKIAEHKALIAVERAEYHERGAAEIRGPHRSPLTPRSRALRQAVENPGLARRPSLRFILIGAEDEDEAKEILDKIKLGAPDGGRIAVEGTWAMAYAERPENNRPFLVLDKLGI